VAKAWLGVTPQNSTSVPDGALGAAVFTAVLVIAVAALLAILVRRFRKVGGV
jgi:uncharacterized membrane protein